MKRRELFIFIAVIVMVFILFIIYATVSLFNNGDGSPPPSTAPLPIKSSAPLRPIDIYPSPSTIPSLLPTINGLSKDDFIDLLPIQTDTFNVEYLSVSDHFVVSIKKNPYQVNKTLAEDWLKGLGLDPNDLNIYWRAFPEIKI